MQFDNDIKTFLTMSLQILLIMLGVKGKNQMNTLFSNRSQKLAKVSTQKSKIIFCQFSYFGGGKQLFYTIIFNFIWSIITFQELIF